jgi:hypothetical protein
MKSCVFALGLFVLALPARGNDELGSSPEWKLPENVYGQFRLVPSKVEKNVTEERGWNGPWEIYQTFAIKVGFSKGHQTFPGNFEYVEPSVGLQGSEEGRRSTSSTTVRLFDRASESEDIEIEWAELPEKLELDREYKAATIAGKDALCSWDVFVRFSLSKPDYVRDKANSGAP